jgi:adenylate cyclase
MCRLWRQGQGRRNQAPPSLAGKGPGVRLRIGLHTGKALRDADAFFGKHVILAARIAGQARGGEILVSGLLKDLTESSGEFRFEEERQMALKGLAVMHRVVAVDWA